MLRPEQRIVQRAVAEPPGDDNDGGFTILPPPAPKANQAGEYRVENVPGGADRITWEMGDGSRANGERITHTYRTTGTFDITVTAYRGARQLDQDSRTVVVADAPESGEEGLSRNQKLALLAAGGVGVAAVLFSQ